MNARNYEIRALGLFTLVLLLVSAAAAQDQSSDNQGASSGQMQVVRWDALLTEAGAEAVKRVAAPLNIRPRDYRGYACKGDALRKAIADAIADGSVEQVGHNLDFGISPDDRGDDLTMPPINIWYHEIGRTDAPGFWIGGGSLLSEAYSRVGENQIRVYINDRMASIQITEGSQTMPDGPTELIDYDGVLSAGDAVAFLFTFSCPSQKEYCQMTVWEAFKADDSAVQLLQDMENCGWWCQNGPDKLRKWGAIASLWTSQASHPAEEVPPDFVKTLDDGKKVKLVALCRPDVAPGCWWGAHGEPVSGARQSELVGNPMRFDTDQSDSLWAEVEVDGMAQERDLQTPATRSIKSQNGDASQSEPYIEFAAQPVDELVKDINVGVLEGDWTELGKLNLGDSVGANGVTYRIDRSASFHAFPKFDDRFSYARLSQYGNSDDVVTATAVGSDGAEASAKQYLQPISIGRPLEFPGSPGQILEFDGLNQNQVKYFRLCERKRQFVTFTGFAILPAAPLPTQ